MPSPEPSLPVPPTMPMRIGVSSRAGRFEFDDLGRLGACRRNPGQSDEKGPAARRRPKAAGEAYFLWLARARQDLRMRSPRLRLRLAQREPAAEGANEADGPLSSLWVSGRDRGLGRG